MNVSVLKLIEEMKDNCIKQANYSDPKAMDKYNALRDLVEENQELNAEIRKYQKDRETNTKRHLEVQDYIKSRIQYCKEMTGFDCCIEELEEILKMI